MQLRSTTSYLHAGKPELRLNDCYIGETEDRIWNIDSLFVELN